MNGSQRRRADTIRALQAHCHLLLDAADSAADRGDDGLADLYRVWAAQAARQAEAVAANRSRTTPNTRSFSKGGHADTAAVRDSLSPQKFPMCERNSHDDRAL